ncbi:MAG: hypothetical protein IIZ64_01345 [Erysipelotrichaceae bacterium]|nr:hypothetical protein [Erysipelotrichaceae bacterium]
MIRYSTSNDRKCRLVRNWCRENGYAYSFDDKDQKNTDTYPFVILAPSYAKEDLLDAIRTEVRR